MKQLATAPTTVIVIRQPEPEQPLAPLPIYNIADPVRALKVAREILADERRVVVDGRNPFEDMRGMRRLSVSSKSKVCRACVLGAISLACESDHVQMLAADAAEQLRFSLCDMTREDGSRMTHADVMAVMDRAIELAEAAT